MQSEIDLLRQRITELEAEKAELEAKNSELLKHVIEETAKYKAENDELKARIEELEKGRTDTAVENARRDVENAELKARVAKLEKESRQPQNDLSPKEPASSKTSDLSTLRK